MNDRRHFLTVLGSTVVSAGLGIACGSSSGVAEASGPIAAGNIKDLAVNDLRAVGGAPVAIGRDATGVYALSTVCTHAQCDMETDGTVSSAGLYCSCHGSRFDRDGKVLQGPASTSLKHWAVTLATDGTITIQAGQEVDAATRLPVAVASVTRDAHGRVV